MTGQTVTNGKSINSDVQNTSAKVFKIRYKILTLKST